MVRKIMHNVRIHEVLFEYVFDFGVSCAQEGIWMQSAQIDSRVGHRSLSAARWSSFTIVLIR